MNAGMRLAILFAAITAIATATLFLMRNSRSDKERQIRDMEELLHRMAEEPEMKEMLERLSAEHEKKISARRSVPLEMKWSAEEIERERPHLEAEIDAAFRDVSKDGGVSWSESEVIDGYGSEEEQTAARALDKDTNWTQLVDDENWRPDPGIGGFSFMDAIGFRYYLPAAMHRSIRSGYDEGIQFHLDVGESDKALREYRLEQVSALDSRQRQCVARFIRYMIAVSALGDEDDYEAKAWLAALDSYWEDAQQ